MNQTSFTLFDKYAPNYDSVYLIDEEWLEQKSLGSVVLYLRSIRQRFLPILKTAISELSNLVKSTF